MSIFVGCLENNAAKHCFIFWAEVKNKNVIRKLNLNSGRIRSNICVAAVSFDFFSIEYDNWRLDSSRRHVRHFLISNANTKFVTGYCCWCGFQTRQKKINCSTPTVPKLFSQHKVIPFQSAVVAFFPPRQIPNDLSETWSNFYEPTQRYLPIKKQET